MEPPLGGVAGGRRACGPTVKGRGDRGGLGARTLPARGPPRCPLVHRLERGGSGLWLENAAQSPGKRPCEGSLEAAPSPGPQRGLLPVRRAESDSAGSRSHTVTPPVP